jgi:hypothetical protein
MVRWQADRSLGMHTVKLVQKDLNGKSLEAILLVLVTVREDLEEDQIPKKP